MRIFIPALVLITLLTSLCTVAKRRKVDLEAVARGAERATAKLVMLEQLEQEAEQIRNATHPLLDLTYHRLVDEKAERLAQLARCLEQQEMVYDKLLYANTQAVWRQWAVRPPSHIVCMGHFC